MKSNAKPVLPLILIFIFLNAFLLAGKSLLDRWGIDREVLIGSNLLLFALSMLTFLMESKAMKKNNPHAFVRSVMGGMMIKMAVCLAAVVIYVMCSGSAFNKAAVFISLFLYLLYLAVEVGIVMKLNKKKNA